MLCVNQRFHSIVCTPRQLDKSLYVERQADRDILEHLRQGEYVYILSTRQVGKTSLIKRATRELRPE